MVRQALDKHQLNKPLMTMTFNEKTNPLNFERMLFDRKNLEKKKYFFSMVFGKMA
jgi:hypothetical protein